MSKCADCQATVTPSGYCVMCGRYNDAPVVDFKILRSGELMIAHIEAQNGDAAEFIDSYFPKRKGADMSVVDSGRIMLAEQDLDAFTAEAKSDGFTVEVEDGV